MSCSFSWHPIDYAYHAEAEQTGETFWVEISDGEWPSSMGATFFFSTMRQAEAVAAAFNDNLKPETNGEPNGPDD